MNPGMSVHLGAAAQYLLTSLVSALLGLWLSRWLHSPSAPIGALWAAISAMMVLQTTVADTWQSTRGQVLGILVGALIAACYLLLWPFNVFGMALCIGATVLVCRLWRFADNGRLAAVTVAVIMVISSLHPGLNPFANAGLRFLEACVGAGSALLVMHGWDAVRWLGKRRRG